MKSGKGFNEADCNIRNKKISPATWNSVTPETRNTTKQYPEDGCSMFIPHRKHIKPPLQRPTG
jgi:hypothetical protein